MSNWFTLLAAAAWKGTVVLGIAWVVALLLRSRSAAARHLVWTAASAALLALPLLLLGLPSLPVRAPAAILDPAVIFHVSSVALSAVNPPIAGGGHAPALWSATGFDLRPWLAAVWAAGAVFGLLQMAVCWMELSRIRRAARPLLDAEVPVLDAGPGRMPLAFGILRPVIFLPSESDGWTGERRALVLRHEMAHIERGDLATHLLARVALALHWWNPLAWLAWREFLKERERAADDLVLASGARASDYAGHLLEIARGMQSPDRLGSAAIAMARRSQLEGRLLAILDSSVNRRSVRRTAPVLAAVAAVLLIAPLAAMRAQQSGAADDAALPRFRSSAAALVQQARQAERDHQTAEADALYAKAASQGDVPEAIPALLYLGRKAKDEGNYTAAQGFFEKAFNIDPNGPHAATALVQLVGLKSPAGRVFDALTGNGDAEAEALYKRALSIQDPNSSAAASTMQLYAVLLRNQNRISEADQYQQRANEIYRKQLDQLTRASRVEGASVHKTGNGVTPPTLLYKLEPQYSEEARAAKFQGTVLLYVEVGPEGLAHNIQVKKSLGLGLDERAVEAVEQWRFHPGTVDGQPATVAATIEINFKLL